VVEALVSRSGAGAPGPAQRMCGPSRWGTTPGWTGAC